MNVAKTKMWLAVTISLIVILGIVKNHEQKNHQFLNEKSRTIA